jgi:hypothetical protein
MKLKKKSFKKNSKQPDKPKKIINLNKFKNKK